MGLIDRKIGSNGLHSCWS